MGCSDQSTKFLKDRGYNVVKHPRKGIRLLELLGRQDKSVIRLGRIDQLIASSRSALPEIIENEPGAAINGQSSSTLTLGIGVNILGTIISAMGGNLGVDVSYTNAKKITFHYTDVVTDRARPLDIGDFLRDGEVDAGNLILREYVLGNGELFLITETTKANKFTVNYEIKRGVGAKVDVPVIQQLVGANVSVQSDKESASTVVFEGPDHLTFGFKCLKVEVGDGDLRLMNSRAGDTALEAVGEARGEILTSDGRIEVLEA